MPEYYHVEKLFLDHLHVLGWTIIDHGPNRIPTDPTISLRQNFREWILLNVFHAAYVVNF